MQLLQLPGSCQPTFSQLDTGFQRGNSCFCLSFCDPVVRTIQPDEHTARFDYLADFYWNLIYARLDLRRDRRVIQADNTGRRGLPQVDREVLEPCGFTGTAVCAPSTSGKTRSIPDRNAFEKRLFTISPAILRPVRYQDCSGLERLLSI